MVGGGILEEFVFVRKELSLQRMPVDVVERIVVRPRGKKVCRIAIDR